MHSFVDPAFQDLRRAEHQNLARQYGDFLAGLGVTADALPFLKVLAKNDKADFVRAAAGHAIKLILGIDP